MDVDHLGSYFSKLLKGPESLHYNINAILGYEVDEDLDSEMTEDEFMRALNALNVNKAAGSDNIPGVVFKSFTDQLISFTVKLFNNILIQPLYKKGDSKDTKNYREITLLPIIGKLFTQILTNRIALWAEKHNILSEAQYGFH